MALVPCKECKAQISSDAKTCPQCGKSQSMGCATLVFLVLGALFLVGLITSSGTGRYEAQNTDRPSAALPTTSQKDLTLEFTWTKAGFENIMHANFTIKNAGPRAIKDIEITCVHSAASGTVIDKNTRTIYEIVKAKSTRRFPKFDMGFIHSQVQSSSCGIDGFKIAESGVTRP